MDAIIRRVLGVGMLGRNEHDLAVERERADMAGIAVLGAGELSDLWH
jgi:hypothetical protein